MGDDAPPAGLLLLGLLGFAALLAGAVVAGRSGVMLREVGPLVVAVAAGVYTLLLLARRRGGKEGGRVTTRATPYARLGDHLAAAAGRGVGRVTLSFAAIAAIIGRPLPPTARDARSRGRSWWTRADGQAHAWDGWLRVGWGVEAVDLAGATVTFARRGAA